MTTQAETAVAARWVEIGAPEDIPPLGSRVVQTPKAKIAVFKNSKGEVFALEDNCPHKNGPLSEGMVHDDCVTCPLHGYNVQLVSGDVLEPDEGHVTPFPVKVEDGVLYLDLSPLDSM